MVFVDSVIDVPAVDVADKWPLGSRPNDADPEIHVKGRMVQVRSRSWPARGIARLPALFLSIH